MPVRIRLAYHPLARRKEPFYHIVAAKSKTARQKKPLEVLGTYDPIPRHPQNASGQLLESQPKLKKISMNVDRIKYWLSVGAEPSGHMARLLRKEANLIPEEPPVQEKKKLLPLKNIVGKKARDVWARQRELIKEENKKAIAALKQGKKLVPGKTQVLSSTGAPLQTRITDVAQELVGQVLHESLYKEVVAIPGKPFLDLAIEQKDSRTLRRDFRAWLEWICPEDQKVTFAGQFQILLQASRERTMPLRFFVAFFHLKPDLGEEHNRARFNLFIEWTRMLPAKQIQCYQRETLDNFLWKMMHQWHDAMVSLGSSRKLTAEEQNLHQIIFNRLTLIRQAARHSETQARECKPWFILWRRESEPIDLVDGLSAMPDTAAEKYFKKNARPVPADYFAKLFEKDFEGDRSIEAIQVFEVLPSEGLDLENNDAKVYWEGIAKMEDEAKARKAAKGAKKPQRVAPKGAQKRAEKYVKAKTKAKVKAKVKAKAKA